MNFTASIKSRLRGHGHHMQYAMDIIITLLIDIAVLKFKYVSGVLSLVLVVTY